MEEINSHRQSARQFARSARRSMTRAETIMWGALRNRGAGVPFRRQMPIGPYFADFACPSARLIVEIDGRTHQAPEARAKDAARQAWLEKQGWSVIRFEDDQVIGAGQLVLDAIIAAVRARKDSLADSGFNKAGYGSGPSPRSWRRWPDEVGSDEV